MIKKGAVVSSHIRGDMKTVVLRVCIADKDDKNYFRQLNHSDKSNLFRKIENDVTEILGVNDEAYSLDDVYIDYGSWYINYTYSVKELLPKEVEYLQKIGVDIVDVVNGNKASLTQ